MSMQRLSQLNITLPPAPKPLGAYTPAVQSGKLIFLSGQLPMVNGELPEVYLGKLGYNVSVENAQAAARQTILNALAILHEQVGLNHIRRIVRLSGYISSTPIFTEQPRVLNAASELLVSIFGEAGVHARLALGVPVLPLDACLEIELIAETE